MFILVTGGSGSGKSEFAENIAMKLGGKMLYVATMKPYDDECLKRIERHRKMRDGKGFRTVECYTDLSEITESADTILLECMSNLTANVMFSDNNDNAFEKIIGGILNLKSENIVIVTNEISSDGIEYDGDTKMYISLLGRINSALSKRADKVYEVVYGIPIESCRWNGNLDVFKNSYAESGMERKKYEIRNVLFSACRCSNRRTYVTCTISMR